MDKETLQIFEDSLARCNADPAFLDHFYETFLAASPRVREKFRDTDFTRQKRALRASLHGMLLAADAREEELEHYLGDLAHLHSRKMLDIGAELYDLWLDSLLSTVMRCDPDCNPQVRNAWEDVMMVGVSYMLSRYHDSVPRPR